MFPKSKLLAASVLLLALFSCSERKDDDLQFYAAASLSDAARELCLIWNAADSVRVSPVLASSSTLARQIVQGAPASIYLSASKDWMDHLARESDRIIKRRDLLSNRLAIIVPLINPIGIKSAGDLSKRGIQRLAIGDPTHVPAGIYAKAWLEDANLWKAVEDRLLPARDVRAALAYVERGEADVGIVYASDAKSADLKPVALLDPPQDMPILYPLALLAEPDGRAPESSAHRFYDWLAGPEAHEIFVKHGFIVIGETQ
jgi:molybdate transport system substrate-binding protein